MADWEWHHHVRLESHTTPVSTLYLFLTHAFQVYGEELNFRRNDKLALKHFLLRRFVYEQEGGDWISCLLRLCLPHFIYFIVGCNASPQIPHPLLAAMTTTLRPRTLARCRARSGRVSRWPCTSLP